MKPSVIILTQFFLGSIALLFAVFFGREFFFRYALVYNEMGRYFDEENIVVYHDQEIPFYGVSFVICLIAFMVVCRWALKTVKFQK